MRAYGTASFHQLTSSLGYVGAPDIVAWLELAAMGVWALFLVAELVYLIFIGIQHAGVMALLRQLEEEACEPVLEEKFQVGWMLRYCM